MHKWRPGFFKSSPIFADLGQVIEPCGWVSWPSCEALMSLFNHTVCNQRNIPIQFVPQDDDLGFPEMYYESRVYETGIISTRLQNWHDFFNAVIWRLMPKSKGAINAQHVMEMAKQITTQRSRQRDALTLFDECGVLIVSSDASLIEALYAHDWLTLFWHNKEKWCRQIRPFIFGHALYEKSLNPYIGLTGKAISIEVECDFFSLNLHQQYHYLDQHISHQIMMSDMLSDPKDLTPFPMLGVPGWWANGKESFYRNQQYFRSKKRA